MGEKKMPLKFRAYMAFYPLKIFMKSLAGKITGGKKMGNFNLEGKKAVVFGIANDQSIAWHIAKKLNDNGVRIAVAYQERVEQLVQPLLKLLKDPIASRCDVVDDALLTEFFHKVEKEFGKVDFLIHSIAFAKKDHLKGKFYEVDRRGYQIAQEVSSYSLAELTNPRVIHELTGLPVLGTLPEMEDVDVERCQFGKLKEVFEDRINVDAILK